MGVFWKALDELNPKMMFLMISGRLVFEILKDKDVKKTISRQNCRFSGGQNRSASGSGGFVVMVF